MPVGPAAAAIGLQPHDPVVQQVDVVVVWVIGLSKVQIPTLGSIIFWALNYNALMIGQTAWIIAPIVATVLLFLGLFLTSTGYNELFAERRGVA